MRPVLGLARDGHSRLGAALVAEQLYWQELDRLRLKIYQKEVRPYASAVRSSKDGSSSLPQQNELRVKLAELHLPENPLRDYGFERFTEEARAAVAEVVNPALLEFLPDASYCYGGLFRADQ